MKDTIRRILTPGGSKARTSRRSDRKAGLQSRPTLDGLEGRQLMTVGGVFDTRTGLLSIYGTSGSDIVRVDYATKVVDGNATTDLNNAKASVKETEAEIKKLTEALYRMESKWTQAG